MSEPLSTRRHFLGTVGRAAGLTAVGGLALRLVWRANGDKVWQLDPSVCDACLKLNENFEGQSRCATECVLQRSAVRAVNDFAACGYCFICPAYHDVKSPLDKETGVHLGKVCPYDAIKRRQVRDTGDRNNDPYEYTIDESKCNGCGKCVLNCKPPMGLGSLRLEVRHNLCVDCNQCAIATACPVTSPGKEWQGAFYRDSARNAWAGKTPKPKGRPCGPARTQAQPRGALVHRTLAALLLILAVTAALAAPAAPAAAEQETYVPDVLPSVPDLPTPTYPEPRSQGLRYYDVLILAGAMLAGAWVVLKYRRRWAVIVLLSACLAYFGFYKAGCVCPIGAIQNVVLSVVDSTYTISIVVTALFLLPLLATLFFGRVFCGAVCPLGACQDLMHRKRVKVPRWLDKTLGWGRWLYLGAAVYWVVGGVGWVLFGHSLAVKRDFVICKYDPFVNIFRAINFRTALAHDWANVFQFVGPWWLWLITGVLLGGSVFIGRPYCRWLCPYGALLGLCSRVSRKKVTVMPDECCDCTLCDEACAFGAIEQHAAVRSTCVACARCYLDCPLERERRGLPVPAYVAGLQPQAQGQQSPGLTPATPPAVRARVAHPDVAAVSDRAPLRGRRILPSTDAVDLAYVDQLVSLYGGDRDAALPILQAIQAHYRYLPHPALCKLVESSHLSMAELLGLATFYNQFRLAPIGEHLVKVCCGTACHVAGARRISDSVRLHLNLTGDADTDAARRFTIQEVACVGCCSLAPVMQVDDATFGHLTAETAVKALATFEPGAKKRAGKHEHAHTALDRDGGVHAGGPQP